MAKKTDKNDENSANDENIGTVPQAPLLIHKQYLKDMSFENPNAPDILQRVPDRPLMDMNVMLDVQKLEHETHEHYYEVTLTLNATAKREDKTMFLAEIVYGAAVSVHGLENKRHHPLLFIEVPRQIFPFARQILGNITQSGGYMPLLVSPVDFQAMYLQRFAQEKAQIQENDQNTPQKTA
ncbi:MAG: protein-export chaperone SecB [Alphaproteobacteria bacterium]|nr:protein-export chaperone SecB [Alphaproteobacteria bacterium]